MAALCIFTVAIVSVTASAEITANTIPQILYKYTVSGTAMPKKPSDIEKALQQFPKTRAAIVSYGLARGTSPRVSLLDVNWEDYLDRKDARKGLCRVEVEYLLESESELRSQTELIKKRCKESGIW